MARKANIDVNVSELNIDIITEQGGKLTFLVKPSVSGPFDLGNVLLDDIIVTMQSTAQDLMEQEINFQPGKQNVTFQFVKNPSGVDATMLEVIPRPPGNVGQI